MIFPLTVFCKKLGRSRLQNRASSILLNFRLNSKSQNRENFTSENSEHFKKLSIPTNMIFSVEGNGFCFFSWKFWGVAARTGSFTQTNLLFELKISDLKRKSTKKKKISKPVKKSIILTFPRTNNCSIKKEVFT